MFFDFFEDLKPCWGRLTKNRDMPLMEDLASGGDKKCKAAEAGHSKFWIHGRIGYNIMRLSS